MIQPRQSAALLMTGVLLPLLVLVMHPTGHELADDPSGRMRAVNALVHGIAIACLPLLATGLAGLCAWLRWPAWSGRGPPCSHPMRLPMARRSRLPPRRPSSAVITTAESQSLMRPASESGEKPPNTTECTAPIRAQASMA